jgi:hypothetical protein
MQPSLGRRVILEHGLISNVLTALGLIDQLCMANICNRTHQITVPWNIRLIVLPIDPLCDFPSLRIPSDDFVCKRTEATIASESGEFFGVVCKSTGLPDGYGVFKAGDWVHCGQVKDGDYQVGRKVSANRKTKVLKLTK